MLRILDQLAQTPRSVVCRCTVEDSMMAVKLVSDVPCALAEIEALRSLSHPNIMELHDYYFEADGRVGIVMPIVQMTLREFMFAGGCPYPALLDILAQFMRGVDHMHTRGVVHMDIKPDNMGLSCTKGGVVCKIFDFGSAVFQTRINAGDQVRTTLEFCAPEALKGLISPAADIYAMGKVFEFCGKHVETFLLEPLVRDMVSANHRLRPSAKMVLVRLGDAADCKRTSTRLHRLVTLVRSSSIEILDYAFWLLQEEAGHEAAAVLSILSFFHDRLYLSRIAWCFYVRTIESLSQAPYFTLTDDMRLHLCTVSVEAACERGVVRILARCHSPSLTAWCSALDRRWGSGQETFDVFLARLAKDGLCEATQLLAA